MDDEFLKKSKNLAKIRRYRCRWRSINRHLSERLSFPCDQGIKSGVAVYHRHSPYSSPLSPTTRSRQDLRVPRSLSRRTREREVSFRSPGGRSRKGSPLEEDRPDPPVPIINLPNRISSASGRLEMVDTRGNVLALSRAPLFFSSLFSFLSTFFLRKHLTARRGREWRNRERGGETGEKSWEWRWTKSCGCVERDETGRRSKGGEWWSVREGSVGRRFHFVSLAACGGAIAAALCQSVTLSRHPFYHLARGCPAPLSIRSTPPHPLLTAPPTSHGYNAGSRQGLPDCLPYLSLSPLSPSLYLLPAISLLVPFPAKWKATPRPPYDPVEGSRRQEESHDKIVKRVETVFFTDSETCFVAKLSEFDGSFSRGETIRKNSTTPWKSRIR